jgi:hypothetical protein
MPRATDTLPPPSQVTNTRRAIDPPQPTGHHRIDEQHR